MVLSLDDVPRHPLEKAWHTPVRNPALFVDGCVQIWPDTDFTKLHEHGCTAYCVTSFRPHDDHANALDALANWWRLARAYPNIRIALTASDIRAAKQRDQAAIVLVSQGGDFIGQNIHRLEAFHRLGLRMMIPVYNARGPLGDGCWEPGNGGLSRLGQQWVDECNRLGVLIDLTHVSERTSLDVLERTRDPVVFSHSNPKALVDSPRNITDEQIRRCAASGGMVGLTSWGPLNFRAGATARPTVDHFIDAVDYVMQLTGIEHVGIGTDMSHGTYPDGDLVRGNTRSWGSDYASVVERSPRSRLRYVEGFDDYGQLPALIAAFERRGYHPDAIEKVLGGNFLRVAARVWGG